MRIAIVAHSIHPERFGGAETYSRAMVKHLQDIDPCNEYFFLLHRDHDAEFGDRASEVILVDFPVLSPYRRVVWEHLRLGKTLREASFDLVHFLGSTAPIGYRGPAVVTIHDTLRYQCPDATPAVLRWYYDLNQRSIVRRNFDVIAVSNHDANVMRKHLTIDSGKQHVVPLGGSERFANVPDSDHAEDFLFLGFPYAHKNVPLLIEAFSRLKASSDCGKLHLVGIPKRENAYFKSLAARSGCQASIILHGPLMTDQLRVLFGEIAVVCLPSSVESFGLPILEGLSCGRSIACTNLPAFIEMFGEHIHASTALTADKLAAAMASARREYQEGKRRECHRDFASQYRWRATAEATARVYGKCLSRSVVADREQ